MPDLPRPIPNPEPVRGLTGFFRICGVRVGTLGQAADAVNKLASGKQALNRTSTHFEVCSASFLNKLLSLPSRI
ncbi:hypothetical protein PGT21_008907 [Puccinia graminis f. sp. tritici]|uniref:Uncharacterized protein n=1 Tax=Puccinia graminis f. sp. tritici TaxID=56615 RepID=A0A5B0NIV6_PUCGR|nr:hypothetical protein PGT21_008907 [Puccinia graminis f. sp. tritici]